MKNGVQEAPKQARKWIQQVRRKHEAQADVDDERERITKLDASGKFEKVARRIRKNAVIAQYYREYGEEIMEAEGARELCELSDEGIKLFRACETSFKSMPKCCSLWEIDEYEEQKVKNDE